MNDKTNDLLARAEALLSRLERLNQRDWHSTDWESTAFRLQAGQLIEVVHPHRTRLDDLLCIDRQKEDVVRNTAQFMQGQPANNVLLWGSRGTGKSTLVKAVFNAFVAEGLRLIELDKHDLLRLPELAEQLGRRPEKFILFCDDLSFEANETGYKSLKAALEGSIAAPPENLLIYATSNRRHLMPEYQQENREARMIDGELHQGESVEEKVSLSERFGIWLSFHPYTQDQYLAIVEHWLGRLGGPPLHLGETRAEALRWATRRGSRSGRVAYQFARDWTGRHALAEPAPDVT